MTLPPLPAPPSALGALLCALSGTLVGGALFAALLGCNLLQTLSLLLRPFSPAAFRRVNRRLADLFWGLCAWTTLRIHGTRVVFTGDGRLPHENALLIANHQSMTDIPALFLLGRRERRLGDMKWFVKDSLRWLPGIGWGLSFLDCLFVERDWATDRRKIERVFARLLAGRVPLWLVTFAEGTRLTAANLERARAFAVAQGWPPPRHVLVPRAKGFVASVEALGGHVGAIYDVTIGYVGGLPSLWQWAAGRLREVHLDVRRWAISELPSSPEELAAWLQARYEEKDARLARFYASGSLA